MTAAWEGNYEFNVIRELELARAISACTQTAINCHSLEVHDLDYTHSLASFQRSEPLDQQKLLLTEPAYNTRNGASSTRKEGLFLRPFVLTS